MSKDIENEIRCSFCGKTQDEVVRLVEGPGVYICDSCINFCSSLLFDDENAYNEKKKKKKQTEKVLPKPSEIKAKLDEY
ncbi:MAG: ATP-dependent Clp protease ATP-binding subunit ClpX, partial [Clostridia bacterium]|nr:ATP-dependent Clp protease ATP-binding subunit ClpX [Clostridia bacterium]